jgi:hypothetical protein
MVSSSDQFLERQGDGEGIIRPSLARVKMKDSAWWFANVGDWLTSNAYGKEAVPSFRVLCERIGPTSLAQ